MTDPDFWLRVARAMHADSSIEIKLVVDQVHIGGMPWHPPTTPAQAWEMHQWVRRQGLELHYMDDIAGGSVVTVYRTLDASEAAQHSGPDDTHALGAAILEMVG